MALTLAREALAHNIEDDLATRNANAGLIETEAATKEESANKVTSFSGTPTDTEYPSAKLVKDQLDLKASQADLTNLSFTGSTHDALVTAALVDSEGVDFGPDGEATFLDGRFNKAEIRSLNQRTNHYYVGANQKYTTINLAYDAWVADGKIPGIIHILAGEYNEQLWAFDCLGNLSIIGEDRHTVIWRTKTGYYRNAPLAFSNGYLKNITFIADITDNPGFVYSPLITDGFSSDIGSAYALHIDFGNPSHTIVENCDMISYVNAGLGCGTRQDQTLEIINCNIYSYTPIGFNAEVFDNGGFLYHSYATSGTTGQRLIMHNVNIFSENGKGASIQNTSPDVSNEVFMEFINVNLSNNNAIPLLTFTSAYGLTMSDSNYGNNCYELNSPITGYIPGKATPNDCVRNGFYLISSSSPDGGSTNTIIQTSMVNSLYGIQNAWILATGIEYVRAMVNGTWSEWVLRVSNADIATNIFGIFNLGTDGYAKATYTNPDDCVKTGIYFTTTNSPDGGSTNTIIHCDMVNSQYGIQLGYILATAVGYKRAMAGGTWGSWSLIDAT